jgi:acetoin utilization deacetylase AcuC-like enzyme
VSAPPHVTLVYDDVFLLHGAGGHPERPGRLEAITARIHGDSRLTSVPWSDAGGADAGIELLTMVHPERYVRTIAAMSDDAAKLHAGYTELWLDPDTYCTPESYPVATRAAGATIWAANLVCRGASDAAFALVRPPGHHATADQAMGFCLFNNAALAARAMQRHPHIARVAIVDIDVHHGNGTQEVFHDDPSVLYASLHQYPYYPGTGAATETGTGAGAGTTLNVPLPAGTGGDAWLDAFLTRIVPTVEAFRPDGIVVSAGYDGHEADPLAGLRLTTATYASAAGHIRRLAGSCDAPMVWVLEGGYDLAALADSVAETVHALDTGEEAW